MAKISRSVIARVQASRDCKAMARRAFERLDFDDAAFWLASSLYWTNRAVIMTRKMNGGN